MNLIPFRKTKLKKILEKHRKLLTSDAFKNMIALHDQLMNLFDTEKVKCRHYQDGNCKHKNGDRDCFILSCPFR